MQFLKLTFAIWLFGVGPAWAGAVPMRVVGTWLINTGDRMSTLGPMENPPGIFEGQLFYLPKDSAPDRTAVYRLYNPSSPIGDHMDSKRPGEGGYRTEALLGYPFNSALPATKGVRRLYKPTNGDHATVRDGDSISGYNGEGIFGYGYPRYKNATTDLLRLSAGAITVGSNKVAGGALWEWQWNGKQFISQFDYGRQIQSAIFFGNANPTEAGDTFSQSTIAAGWRHGSPLVTAINSGASQTTASIPIDFMPGKFGGGQHQPVVWTGWQIGKTITLNFNAMPRVARYVTTVVAELAQSSAQVEIPTIYTTGEFTRHFTYNVGLNSLVEVFPARCSDTNVALSNWNGAGAVIVATQNLSHAIGQYGRKPASGGSVDYLTLWEFIGGACGTGTKPLDFASSKTSAVRGPFNLPAGKSSYTTYIASGTLSQVRSDFRDLYLKGF
jgi:hypothetical protein